MAATYKIRLTPTVGRVRPDQKALHAWMREGGGPIQRDMERRGTNTIMAWRADVPPGLLNQTFRVQPGTSQGWGVTCLAGVGQRTHYLGYYHDGTRPHIIAARPTRKNPHLRFIQNGRVRFAKKVRHPGFRGNPFIERNLAVALR